MDALTNSCLSKTYEHIMNKKTLKELFVDGTKGIVASPNLNYNWLYEQLTKKILMRVLMKSYVALKFLG